MKSSLLLRLSRSTRQKSDELSIRQSYVASTMTTYVNATLTVSTKTPTSCARLKKFLATTMTILTFHLEVLSKNPAVKIFR